METFATAVYLLVVNDRNQQLDNHMRQVANSSAGTLEIIQHEYEELTTEDKYQGYVPIGADGRPLPITLVQLMGKYKTESATQITASPLVASHQGVEWYDDAKRLMVVTEGCFSRLPYRRMFHPKEYYGNLATFVALPSPFILLPWGIVLLFVGMSALRSRPLH